MFNLVHLKSTSVDFVFIAANSFAKLNRDFKEAIASFQ